MPRVALDRESGAARVYHRLARVSVRVVYLGEDIGNPQADGDVAYVFTAAVLCEKVSCCDNVCETKGKISSHLLDALEIPKRVIVRQ